MSQTDYQVILDYVEQQPVIDTHEHIQPQNEVAEQGVNIFTVFKNSYARLDFVSAGMPEEAWELGSEEEIWEVFSRYQPFVLQTE
ncbi:MAG: hypothetical protein ABFS16_14410 [Bacteroidota bacterium]